MSINLNELPALVEKLQKLDRDLDLAAIKTAILGTEEAIADMAEKLGPELAKAIAEALVKGLSGVKLGGGEAPIVNVTVPKFDIPSPVLAKADVPTRMTVDVERAVNGMAKRYSVTFHK